MAKLFNLMRIRRKFKFLTFLKIVCLGICYIFFPAFGWSQSKSPKEIKDPKIENLKLKADTSSVHFLLNRSDLAIENVSRISAQDSAVNFAMQAKVLSEKIKYDSGLVKSCLQEIKVWDKIRESEMKSGGDGQNSYNKKSDSKTKLMNWIKENGTMDQVGEGFIAIAEVHNQRADVNFPELLALYDSAAFWFEKSGNKIRQSETLYHVGFMHMQNGQLAESIPVLHRSIDLVQPNGRKELHDVYGLLGNAYSFSGNYNLGLKYQLKALQQAEAQNDTTGGYGVLQMFLGLTYEKLKNFDLALDHFKEAYRILENHTDKQPGDFNFAASNTAKMMIKKDPQAGIIFINEFIKKYSDVTSPQLNRTFNIRLMQANMYLKRFDEAQKYCNLAIKDLDTFPKNTGIASYMAIIQYLVLSEQYAKAENFLPIAQQIASNAKQLPNLQDLYYYSYQIDSARGEFQSALSNYKLFKAYSDSVLNEVKVKEIAELEISYETESKQQAIDLLTKDSELTQQKLEQSNLVNNVTFAGVGVLALLLILGGNQYRIKKKSNRLLLNQQNEISRKNASLQKLVVEKEWLLKEIHHRTKNNLQTVVSLLESQAAYLHNSEALTAIQDSQNRVHTMSLIHQKLYQTENLAAIEMDKYLHELLFYLKDSFNIKNSIRFDLYADPLVLDVTQAIPIALIMNEALTNAIKYAFLYEDYANTVTIKMTEKDSLVSLIIQDNGQGLPEDFDIDSDNCGLGLKLMKGLAEDVEGTFELVSNLGVRISVVFTASRLLHKSI